MDPNHVSTLRAICSAAKAQKQELVNRYGVGTDIPAALATTVGRLPLGCYPLGRGEADVAGLITSAIALSDADLAVVIQEVYASTDDIGSALAPRFAAGDPTVTEGLLFIALPRGGHPKWKLERYRYVGRDVDWLGSGVTPADDVIGPYAPLADQAYTMQRRREGPAPLTRGAQLLHVGTCQHDDTLFVHFALQQSCPCGSGRTMNECCALRN
jgi:hypothetical protein